MGHTPPGGRSLQTEFADDGGVLAQAFGPTLAYVGEAAEDRWVSRILTTQHGLLQELRSACTPGYYNAEGRLQDQELMKYASFVVLVVVVIVSLIQNGAICLS